MSKLINVAGKEIRDHITTRRFLVIFALLAILSVYSMVTGLSSYYQTLEDYKDPDNYGQSWRYEAIDDLSETIQDAEASGADPELINALTEQRNLLANPEMPSMLNAFEFSILLFAVLGAILGVSLGFDVITKEKDEGTLKTVLSGPLYRDTLINGKAIGAIVTLSIALAAAFLLMVAVMVIMGIVPSGEDIVRIVIYYFASLLYCGVFFAIAMMASVIAKNSTMAILYTIGIVFVLFFVAIIAPLISNSIAEVVIGPEPVHVSYYEPEATNGSTPNLLSHPTVSPDRILAYTESQAYQEKRSQVVDVLCVWSPINDFIGGGSPGIASAILSKESYDLHNYIVDTLPMARRVSLSESLGAAWYKILALLIDIIIAFAVSYVIFLRTDIR